jgi:hypothetical protein
VGGLIPATNTTAPIRQHDSVAATALYLLERAQCGQLVDQVDREDPDQRWRASNGSGAWANSSVAQPPKRWMRASGRARRDGQMALRWCAAGMAEASKQFRRVNGHLHLPALRDALERHAADQAVGGDYNTHDVSTA